jgi:hypothetical protein
VSFIRPTCCREHGIHCSLLELPSSSQGTSSEESAGTPIHWRGR